MGTTFYNNKKFQTKPVDPEAGQPLMKDPETGAVPFTGNYKFDNIYLCMWD